MPTEMITAGTVIFNELKKKWPRLALPATTRAPMS